MKVLVVGRRGSRADACAHALEIRGHAVDRLGVAEAADTVDERYDVVAFTSATKDEGARRIMDRVRALNPRAQRMEPLALAPVLFVAQAEWAGRRALGATEGDPRVVVEAVPIPRVAIRRVGGVSGAEVEILRHRIAPWGTSRPEHLSPRTEGTDSVAYFPRRPASSRDFVSVRIDGAAVFVGDSLGRRPLCQ